MGASAQARVVLEGGNLGTPVIHLSGELDTSSADGVAGVVDGVLAREPERVVFDLSELTFMDSSGLALLLTARRSAEVELRGTSSAVRRVIEVSGLEGLFELQDGGERRRQRFAGAPESVSAARRFTTQGLNELEPDVLDVVAVMVSELTTNAVQHSGTDFEVSLGVAADLLRVEVSDSGGGRPEVRQPSPDELRGRGLRIVEELSDSWGVSPRADGGPGKTVWFELTTSRP